MNYILSIYVGTIEFLIYPNFFYLFRYFKASSRSYITFRLVSQITWLAKPIFGILADNFAPFRRRITFYSLIVIFGAILAACSIVFFNFTFFGFLGIFGLLQLSIGFLDSLGEGISILITRTELRKTSLESQIFDQPFNHPAYKMSIKSIITRYDFAKFYLIRELSRSFSLFAGSLIFEPHHNLKKSDIRFLIKKKLLYFCYRIVFDSFLHYLFFQRNKSKFLLKKSLEILGKFSKTIEDFKTFYKILKNPIFYKALFIIFMLNSQPELTDASIYLLQKSKKWIFVGYGLKDLLAGIFVFVLIFLFLRSKYARKYELKWVLLAALAAHSFGNFGLYGIVWIKSLPFWALFLLQLGYTIGDKLSSSLVLCFFFQIFNECCPEGFENTGVTLVLLLYNAGIVSGNILGYFLIKASTLNERESEKFVLPLAISHSYLVVVILLLAWVYAKD